MYKIHLSSSFSLNEHNDLLFVYFRKCYGVAVCGCEPSAQRPVVASGAVPSVQTSCDSVVTGGVVDGEGVALKVCGCEPSAQRPVVASGAVPSVQTSCCSGRVVRSRWSTVALKACGCEPSAQRPVVGSGAVPSLQTSCCSAVVTPAGCSIQSLRLWL